MKNKNKILSLALLLTLSIFILPMISAGVTMIRPLSNTNHSTTTLLFNVTFVNNTDIIVHAGQISNISNINASFYYSPGGVRTLIGYSTTCDKTEATNTTIACWGTLAISGLTEGSGYVINATVWSSVANATFKGNANTTVDVVGVTFDRTNPNVDLDIPLSGESQSNGRGIDYKCGSNDNVDTAPTTVLTVTHPTGDPITSTSLTAPSTSYNIFTDTDYDGDYLFTCSVNDYTGNSISSSKTVTVDKLGRVISVSGNNGTNNYKTLILFGGIIIGIWLFARKKK